MKPNKININRSKISSKEIAKHKDFDGLLNKVKVYHIPVYRQTWFVTASVAAAAAIIIIAWFFLPFKNTSIISQSAFIVNPIKGIDVPYSVYTIDADSGKEITFTSGSRIKVPANAFTDAQGKVLKGKVQVKYREFRDAVDIFVSGIPMIYDSGGTKYQFESAGMCEILALQDGQPVNPNPSSPIIIQYRSNYPGTQYNLYELDTNARNWKCIGKDKVEPIAKEAAKDSTASRSGASNLAAEAVEEKAIKKLNTEIAALEKTKPTAPIKADKSRRNFKFKVNLKQFPELSTYTNVMFAIEGVEDKDIPKDIYSTVWKKVQLDENVKGVNYKMTLTKDAKTYSYIVSPVFEGEDYDKAKKLYDDKYVDYKAAIAQKKAEEKRLAEEMAAYKKDMGSATEITEEDINKVTHADDTVFRTFTAMKFNVIFNCDRIKFMSNYLTIHSHFEYPDGLSFQPKLLYIANNKLNGIMTFFGNLITYESGAKNTMWTLTSDNKLAYFTSDDFKAIPKTDNYTFKMHIYEGELKTEDDVRKVLGI